MIRNLNSRIFERRYLQRQQFLNRDFERRSQQPDQISVMLFCQNTGGRHHSSLSAAAADDRSCQGGYNGFAGADVSLNQPVHRVSAGQVVLHFGDDPLLRPGEGKGRRANWLSSHAVSTEKTRAACSCHIRFCARTPNCNRKISSNASRS